MKESVFEITMPQLGVNDATAIVVDWLVRDGQRIEKGAPVATIETSKATVDLESEAGGFIFLIVEAGATVPIQQVIAIVTSSADDQAAQTLRARFTATAAAPPGARTAEAGAPRFTKKARALVERFQLDVSKFPTGRILSENDVIPFCPIEETPEPFTSIVDPSRRVAIFGASQGGRAVMTCVQAMGGYEVAAFLDDNPTLAGGKYYDRPVWPGQYLETLGERGVGLVATHIGAREFRLALRDRVVRAGLAMLNVIHPSAVVDPSVRMGNGNLIKAGAVLDADVSLGDCCIIDNGVIVPHHNRIGHACHLAPGVRMGGDCTIGDCALIGVGAVVTPRLTIGRNTIVAPGACVTRDLPEGVVAEGVPARIVGKRR